MTVSKFKRGQNIRVITAANYEFKYKKLNLKNKKLNFQKNKKQLKKYALGNAARTCALHSQHQRMHLGMQRAAFPAHPFGAHIFLIVFYF